MLVEPEVVAKAQTGDVSAFNAIVGAYRKRILGTIYRLIGRGEDVEDVAQDVFVRLYYSLDQLRSVEVFEPWLYRLTSNAAYDYLRRRKRSGGVRMADLSEEQVIAADAAESGRRTADEQDAAETREFVETLFREVSEEDRILLTLKEVQGLSLKELGQVYGVNENALKVRLFRARKRALRAYDKLKKRKAL
ncbi:MAG: sigma-70 family RNA polymerase sigma factor [Bryobacterales bacterium]|nr:sigma-70 family RNA polymerase sigma factor [Acidobacteriota bacterium]MCB9384078.1 sigma-70 family RNA polymerase sigma factor [Bryobacterales bacterium]